MRDAVEAAAEGAREGFTKAVVNAAVEKAVSKVRAKCCIFQAEEFSAGSIITSGRAFVTKIVFNEKITQGEGYQLGKILYRRDTNSED